ncbi:hypothetical protein PVAP13_1NG497800 [Panicum virgatum]|uniref:Uncharacterized protein n=1 Tax=Panicum virgatum TaxID=38727 RepID=A0A8T0WPY7_PANVG|nr:hypothetical protein PVAP13_1NG497800 [Panicum virgatum]
MPPRRRRRAPAKPQSQPDPQQQESPGEDAPLEERLAWDSHQESECRITAIKAIKDAEAGNMAGNIRSQLQLLRSYFSKEQLEANALEYFKENLPNLSIVPSEKYDVLELKWNDGDKCILGDFIDDKILQASIASLPAAGGLQFPGNSVGKDFYRRTSSFSDFGWSEIPEWQMAGTSDAFQTPGAVSNRLSFGKVTQEWRYALICARFTSWGLQRRKSSSYSGYSPCSFAFFFFVPEAYLVFPCQLIIFLPESGNGDEDAPS